MRVRLRREAEDGWLDHAAVYTVLGIYSSSTSVGFRLLGTTEPTTPAIHPASSFDVVDGTLSPRWVCSFAADGHSMSLEPKAWTCDGFWDRYFDEEPEAVRIFQDELRLLYGEG